MSAMTSHTYPQRSMDASTGDLAAVEARAIAKTNRSGETKIRALDDVSVEIPPAPHGGDHGLTRKSQHSEGGR